MNIDDITAKGLDILALASQPVLQRLPLEQRICVLHAFGQLLSGAPGEAAREAAAALRNADALQVKFTELLQEERDERRFP